VLSRLSAGPAPVSELARPFTWRWPSFTQHLEVLEHAGCPLAQGGAVCAPIGWCRSRSGRGALDGRQRALERRLDQLGQLPAGVKER